jgi:sugar (pentulose or hexulose) kinase
VSLVGIDIGSSAVKAGAYDETGAPIALVREPVEDHYPSPGA